MLQSYYVITARSVLSSSFSLRYYGITASYFTFLSYWHQSYCKSKCLILITLLRQGTLLLFPIGIKATVKASVSFLLRCYTITARYSTLLISIKATVNTSVFSYYIITLLRQGTSPLFLTGIKTTVKASVSFWLRCYAITARYFTLLSY